MEIREPGRMWRLVWERLQNGCITPSARSYIYLIIHQRVGTKERGNRLMPGRFTSPNCPRCRPAQIIENCQHRYQICARVYHIWEWILSVILVLDPLCAPDNEMDYLSLNFPRSMRDNEIMWLIGSYVDLIEKVVILKDLFLNLDQVKGILRQKKLMSKYQAMPDLGLIPGLDFSPQGIG